MALFSDPRPHYRGVRMARVLSAVLATASGSVMAAGPPAEIVYQHGTVYTVDHTGTVAQALAISGGRITYVGTDEGAKPLIGKNTAVIDLGGRMVMPGLVDGHMHPVAAGMDLLKCNLNYASLSVAQFQARLQGCLDERRKTEGPDTWLEVVNWFRYGMGAAAAGVDRKVLDSLKTQRPIMVHDSFGHSSLVNSRALTLAKITAQTRDPVGGRIDRDGSGSSLPTDSCAASSRMPVGSPEPSRSMRPPTGSRDCAVIFATANALELTRLE